MTSERRKESDPCVRDMYSTPNVVSLMKATVISCGHVVARKNYSWNRREAQPAWEGTGSEELSERSSGSEREPVADCSEHCNGSAADCSEHCNGSAADCCEHCNEPVADCCEHGNGSAADCCEHCNGSAADCCEHGNEPISLHYKRVYWRTRNIWTFIFLWIWGKETVRMWNG
jgi:hypothetical protein